MIPGTLDRLLVIGGVLAVAAGCARPHRVPLPAPFPLTRGGSPVPGKGLGASLELGDGLQGQELLRKELVSASLVFGIGHRVNLSIGPYGGHESDDPGGTLATGKVRVGHPLGPRSSSAVHVALAWVDRTDGEAQDESLTAVDVAVPTELLLLGPADGATFGLYAGPRLVYEDYRDRLEPADGFSGLIPGGLAGIHLGLGHFHAFGEGTVAFAPETSYRGTRYGGGAIFLPTGGVIAFIGSPFPWDR